MKNEATIYLRRAQGFITLLTGMVRDGTIKPGPDMTPSDIRLLINQIANEVYEAEEVLRGERELEDAA